VPTLSNLVIRYAAQGYQQVLDAERRVRSSISETARRAAKDEGVTKRWMDRHKAALTGIGVAAAGAMAAIIAGSPTLQAELGETQLWFSMFAEAMGSEWSPALDWFNGLLEDAYDAFEDLPGPGKTAISVVAGTGIAAGIAIPALAMFIWSLGTIGTTLSGISFAGILGGLAGISLAATIVAGLILGGIGVWALWKTGVLNAVYGAGDAVFDFAYNAGASVREFATDAYDRIWNWADSVGGVFGDLVKSALRWGADIITNYIDGIRSKFQAFYDAVNSLRSYLESALSFDIAANDRMAQRWGSDFMMHFSAGMQAPQPVMSPVAPVVNVAAGGGGGGNVYLTIERGAIQINGSEARGLDESKLVRLVDERIADTLRSRSR